MATTLQISGTPAEIYERHMVPAIFARWAPDLVEAAGVRTGESALDVACGTGAVTRLLAERVGPTGKVAGLDINPGMLAVARLVAPVRTSNGWKAARSRYRDRMRPSTLSFASRDSNSFLRSRRPSPRCAECSGAAPALHCRAGARSNTLRAISCSSRPWPAESVPKRRRSHRSALEMQERSEAWS